MFRALRALICTSTDDAYARQFSPRLKCAAGKIKVLAVTGKDYEDFSEGVEKGVPGGL